MLKGLAVIFMIQVHVMEQFASVAANETIIGHIFYFLGGPFCAPVFVAVMGYFLAASDKSFMFLLKRGVALFLLGILLNIVRSIHLLITIFQGKYDLDPLHFIFGADILTLAGLSIVLIALLQLISKKNLLLYLSLMVLFAVVGSFVHTGVNDHRFYLAFITGNSSYSYFPLFPWFSYVLSGYIFKLIYDQYKNYIHKFTYIHRIFLGLLSLILLVFTPYAFKISADLPAYYHHGFAFFLWVIGFMMLYVVIIHYITKWVKITLVIDYLSWTGQNVTVIYIIQWIIIGNIATAIYRTQNLIQSVLWFVGITLVSCLLAVVYMKIKAYYQSRSEDLL